MTIHIVSNDERLAFMYHSPFARAVLNEVNFHCFGEGTVVLLGFVTILHSDNLIVFVELIELDKIALANVVP